MSTISVEKLGPEEALHLKIRVAVIRPDEAKGNYVLVVNSKESDNERTIEKELDRMSLANENVYANKLWNESGLDKKMMIVSSTFKENFEFLSDDQKEHIKSAIFYRVESPTGKIGILCIDANKDGIFPDKDSDLAEYNLYKTILRSIETRFEFEKVFHTVSINIKHVLENENFILE